MRAEDGFRLLLCASLGWVPAAHAQSARHDQLLVVVNRAEEKVSLFKADGTSLTLLKALPVGKTPREVCLSPDGKRAYVSNQDGNSVTVVDLDGQTVAGTIAPPDLKSPDGCVVSGDSRKLYVVAMGRDSLFVFSTADHKLQKEIPLPLKVPRRVVFTPDAQRLFVGCNQTPEIAIIDAATDSMVRTFKVGNEARGGLAFTPDGKTFLVGNVEDDTVSWVDMGTLAVQRVVGVGMSPQRIEVSRDGEFAFVLSRIGAGVFCMPLKKKHDASKMIPVGKAPWGLATNGDGTLLYASSNADDNITVIDVANLKVVSTVPGGKDPNGLAFRP